jgi:exopolysaccharide biosynthesis protein
MPIPINLKNPILNQCSTLSSSSLSDLIRDTDPILESKLKPDQNLMKELNSFLIMHPRFHHLSESQKNQAILKWIDQSISLSGPECSSKLGELIEVLTPEKIPNLLQNVYIPKELLESGERSVLEAYLLSANGVKDAEKHAARYYQVRLESILPKENHLSAGQVLALVRLIPAFTLPSSSIELFSKDRVGNNAHFKVVAGDSTFFVKYFNYEDIWRTNHGITEKNRIDGLPSLQEASASKLANFITGGLVPEGRTFGNAAIVYPLIDLDKDSTKNILEADYHQLKKEKDLYPILTQKQREQLFVHMIADLLIENRDTHLSQFGIDKDGNLIGFDKGSAFHSSVFSANRVNVSEPKFAIVENSPVYRLFIENLRKHPNDLMTLLHSNRVQEVLDRVEDIPKETLTEILSPMNQYIWLAKKSPLLPSGTLKDVQHSRFKQVRKSLAQFFEIGENALQPNPRMVLNYQEINDPVTGASANFWEFDPKKHPLTLATSVLDGCTGVQDCVEKKGGLAGTNAGFFNENSTNRLTIYMKKATNQLGYDTGSPIPSSVLKAGGVIITDSGKLTPAVGWKKDGSGLLMGYLKSNWIVQGRELGLEMPVRIARRTDLNPADPHQYLHLPLSGARLGKDYLRVQLKNGRIENVKEVKEGIDPTLPNSYILHDSELSKNPDWAEKFKSEKALGKSLPIQHEYHSDTKGWEELDSITNGGAILIQDGQIAPESQNNIISLGTRSAHAFLCEKEDGTLMQGTELSNRITLEQLQKFLFQRGCKNAISLDGGGSPAHYLNFPGEAQRGFNRHVSDVLIVQRKPEGSTSAEMGSRLNSFIESGDMTSFLKELQDHPELMTTSMTPMDKLGRTLPHLVMQYGNGEMVNWAFKNFPVSDLLKQDLFKTSPLAYALANGHHREILDYAAGMSIESPEGAVFNNELHKLDFGKLLADAMKDGHHKEILRFASSLNIGSPERRAFIEGIFKLDFDTLDQDSYRTLFQIINAQPKPHWNSPIIRILFKYLDDEKSLIQILSQLSSVVLHRNSRLIVDTAFRRNMVNLANAIVPKLPPNELLFQEDDDSIHFHTATQRGWIEIVRSVASKLQARDLFLLNGEGDTPVHIAARRGDEKMLEVFLPKLDTPVLNLSSRDGTPLDLAMKSGNPEAVKVLLKSSLLKLSTLKPALRDAVSNKPEMVEVLLEAIPAQTILTREKVSGESILDLAIKANNPQTVQQLLDKLRKAGLL